MNFRAVNLVLKKFLGSVCFFSEIGSISIGELKFHRYSEPATDLPQYDMSFLDPGGTLLNFDFSEVLLVIQEPAGLFGSRQICNADRLNTSTQGTLDFNNEDVFGGKGEDLGALKTTDTAA